MSPALLKGFGWALIILSTIVLFTEGAVAAGVLISLGGLLLNQAQAAKQSHDKLSMFYLDSCIKAYEEARRLLLDDGNNNRATWIAAGRSLMLAKELSNKIAIESHRTVLEVHQLKYRGAFHEALHDKTASFFYGVDPLLPLEQAAKASTAGEQNYAGRVTVSTVHELSEKSLYAAWEAAQWPQGYKDLLNKEFSPEQRQSVVMFYPGLSAYLEHKSKYHSVGGVLKKREEKP